MCPKSARGQRKGSVRCKPAVKRIKPPARQKRYKVAREIEQRRKSSCFVQMKAVVPRRELAPRRSADALSSVISQVRVKIAAQPSLHLLENPAYVQHCRCWLLRLYEGDAQSLRCCWRYAGRPTVLLLRHWRGTSTVLPFWWSNLQCMRCRSHVCTLPSTSHSEFELHQRRKYFRMYSLCLTVKHCSAVNVDVL